MTVRTNHRPAVLIADDHPVVADGFAMVLTPYFDVKGVVTDLDALPATIATCRPDVVVLDLAFGERSSIPVMQGILARRGTGVSFVVLTGMESRAVTNAALRGGASAVLLKGCSTQDLRLAIEAASQGRTPQVRRTDDAGASGRDRSTKVRVGGVWLRARHAAVLVLLLEGMDRRTIASRLDMTVKGVDYCVRTAKDATGIHALVGLLHWAMEHQVGLRHAARHGPSGHLPGAGGTKGR